MFPKEILHEITDAAAVLARLQGDGRSLTAATDAFAKRDAATLRAILEPIGPRCRLVCRWLLVFECRRQLTVLCRELRAEPFSPDELVDFADRVGALAQDQDALVQLLDAVDEASPDRFDEIVRQYDLMPYCQLVVLWVCSIRYQLFCDLVCEHGPVQDELAALRRSAEGLQKLGGSGHLADALELHANDKAEELQALLQELDLSLYCLILCRWLCLFGCLSRCWILCRDLAQDPIHQNDLKRLVEGLSKLAADQRAVGALIEAHRDGDEGRFSEILEKYQLQPFCMIICFWLCWIWCGLFCRRLCPPALRCELTAPTGCVPEEAIQSPTALVVAVEGTAAGAAFDHYTLAWRQTAGPWQSSNFHYPPIPPGGGSQGNSPVNAGLLGYFDTTALDEGGYDIRLTVVSKSGATSTCVIAFSLFKQDVRILGVNNYTNLDTNEYDPAAKLVETIPALCSRPSSVAEVSFGGAITIQGSAFVGGCDDREIDRYQIDYKPGFEPNPATGGWLPIPGEAGSVDYNTVWQYRDMNMRRDTSDLTAGWRDDCVISGGGICFLNVPDARLQRVSWQTKTGPCELSGLITLRLGVRDTSGNWYYDVQRVWIDNKPACAMIRIDAVPECSDIRMSQFAGNGDCATPWVLPLVGIAYDEYIDDALPLVRPNDNFGNYRVWVSKQGGSQVPIPIDSAIGTCFHGTDRVGDPGTDCVACDPASPDPAAVFGKLADFDLRALDPHCSPMASWTPPANLQIPRGECCTYVFKLIVVDTTRIGSSHHWAEALWPVKICNDLPTIDG